MAPQARVFTDAMYNHFNKVDEYICSSLLPADASLESALKANAAANLDAIDVAPNQGKMLYMLAKLNRAKRILEVGTLGGYSSIWFAKAVPSDGKVITLELEDEHARVARSNIANAGFESVVEVKVGPALETLEAMGKEGNVEPFDMVFIDADKENNVGYLKWALEFSRVGTLIVVDNTVRRGRIIDEATDDTGVIGTRKTYEFLKKEKRLEATGIQTVGSKGWDGFVMAVVIN